MKTHIVPIDSSLSIAFTHRTELHINF